MSVDDALGARKVRSADSGRGLDRCDERFVVCNEVRACSVASARAGMRGWLAVPRGRRRMKVERRGAENDGEEDEHGGRVGKEPAGSGTLPAQPLVRKCS